MNRFKLVALCATMLLALTRRSQCGEPVRRDPVSRFVKACMDIHRAPTAEQSRWLSAHFVMMHAFGTDTVIRHIEARLDDPSDIVRAHMLDWLGKIGLSSGDPRLRRRVVNRLTAALEREGTTWPVPRKAASKCLLQFTAGDFSEEAKERLVERLAGRPKKRAVLSEAIQLVGVANIRSQIPVLATFASDPPEYGGYGLVALGPPGWEARKARARMGVKEDLARCIEIVESQPDPRKRVVEGFRDLSYIRRPEIVAYLAKYLESDEMFRPNGWEELVHTRGFARSAGFAASVLREMVRGFPAKDDLSIFFDDNEIRICREWMAKRKEYDVVVLPSRVYVREPVPGPEDGEPTDADRRTIERLLSTYVELLKENKRDEINVLLARTFGAKLMAHVEPYLHDPSGTVRWFAYTCLGAIGLDCQDRATRREIVGTLAKGMADSEKGWSPHFAACQYLFKFGAEDFTETSKGEIARLLKSEPSNPDQLGKLILLAGHLDIRSVLPLLRTVVENETAPPGSPAWWKSPGWAAMRARARMGAEEDVRRCIELVDAEADMGWRFAERIPELVRYVRGPQVVRLLHEYLDSDAVLPRRQGRVAQYAAYHLSAMVHGFPVKKEDPRLFSGDDIRHCREWMGKQDPYDGTGMQGDPPMLPAGRDQKPVSKRAPSQPVVSVSEPRARDIASPRPKLAVKTKSVPETEKPVAPGAVGTTKSNSWAPITLGYIAAAALGGVGIWLLLRRRAT